MNGKGNKIRKGLVFGIVFVLVFVVFAGIPMNVSAEESNEIILEGEHWVFGNGTVFKITNSTYLNVTLTSSENVHVHLDSTPKVVSFYIEANCTATSTDITITGFEACKKYYRYQDGNLQENFTTDINGSYSYTQDILTYHHVFIQEITSTLYIYESITLTSDIYESIYIMANNIILDGNGYTVHGSGTFGIYLFDRSGVTIKNLNIDYFSAGIFLVHSSDNIIDGNTFTNCGDGIYPSDQCSNNIINGNTILEGSFGITTLFSDSDIISGNTVSSNGRTGIRVILSDDCVISDNRIMDNDLCEDWLEAGLLLTHSTRTIVSGNIISGNKYRGIYSQYSHDSTIITNSISIHQYDIFFSLSNGATIKDNTITESRFGIFLQESDSTAMDGNKISNSDYGIYIAHSISNTLLKNRMEGNGIFISGSASVWNSQTIETTNKVNGASVLFWKNINGGTINGNYGQVILANCMNVIVKDLNVSYGTAGILVGHSSSNTIMNNEAWNNTIAGIYMVGNGDNTVSGNAVLGNDAGIYLYDTDSNTVNGNTVSNNNDGIKVYGSSSNTVSGNSVYTNTVGIRVEGSEGNTVSENVISYNDWDIYLIGSASVTLTENEMIGTGISISGQGINGWKTHTIDTTNTVNGKPVYYWKDATSGTVPSGAGQVILANCMNVVVEDQDVNGIQIGYSTGITIMNNIASNNKFGVYLRKSHSITITNNEFTNSDYAIDLGQHDTKSNNNIITGNKISNCDAGIYIRFSDGNTISGNTFSGINNYCIRFGGSCYSNIISGNTVSGCEIFIMPGCHYNTISGNNVSGCEIGISSGIANTISGNNVSGCEIGISSGISNTISDNNVSGCEIGISSGDSNTISGNNVMNNNYGFHLSNTRYITMNDNEMWGNGIFISGQQGYWNAHTIDTSNTVNGKPVYYLKDAVGGTIPAGAAGQVILANCKNVVVENQDVSNASAGILMGFSSGNTISDIITSDNEYGIYLKNSDTNTISENTFSDNEYGFYLDSSSSGSIFHNNIIDNTNQLYNYNSQNTWDDGAGEGNYWSDYTGSDTNSDGIGDTKIPHPDVDQGNGYYQLDNYPLMDVQPNTEDGPNMEVFAGGGVTMHFSEVTSPGFTYAKTVDGSPPAHFRFVPINTYYDISTTAGFEGTITISIPYNDFGISLDEEKNLKLEHFDETQGKWVEITTWVDTDNNIIYGETNSLSKFAIMLDNEAPVATITAPSSGSLYKIGTQVTFTGTFTDEDTEDTHTAKWTFTSQGVSFSIGGTVTESGGSGSVTDTYTFTTLGVYTVTLTVTDNGGVSDITNTINGLPAMVVIYDPEGGFVTGGGWINSPEGAYIPSSSLSGKASFGFVSKYKKGTTEPIGNTEFEFDIADFEFHSTSYDWLVIAGAMAQFKGTGTINDEGEYKFKLWATDGALVQGGGDDAFRIKIWEEDEYEVETVIYDNKVDTELGGGSIVIHKA